MAKYLRRYCIDYKLLDKAHSGLWLLFQSKSRTQHRIAVFWMYLHTFFAWFCAGYERRQLA